MTRLLWGEVAQKRHEAGVDRGVLYPEEGPGVVWNGLTEVEESFVGGESNSYYFDGIKFLDIVSTKSYQASITTFSAPDQFGPCLGEIPVVPGFILTRQPRRRFGFSYRTLIGDFGYKIHLVYNALVSPNGRPYTTLNGATESSTLTYQIDAVPPKSETFRPSAHFVVDSTRTDPVALQVLETILYGSGETDPYLPDVAELLGIASMWNPLIITEDQVGGYASLTPGLGDVYETAVSGLFRVLPDTRLVRTSLKSGYYEME